jgi:hypothetical protein
MIRSGTRFEVSVMLRKPRERLHRFRLSRSRKSPHLAAIRETQHSLRLTRNNKRGTLFDKIGTLFDLRAKLFGLRATDFVISATLEEPRSARSSFRLSLSSKMPRLAATSEM